MPKRRLTDSFLQRTKAPAAGRVDYFDAAFPGLAFRVSATGVRAWSVITRVNGRQVRIALGKYPAVPLGKARKKAAAAIELIEAGKDPRIEARRFKTDTVRAVADRFLADIGAPAKGAAAPKPTRPLRTAAEIRRTLEAGIVAEHGARPIRTITRRDLIDLFDGIAAERGGIAANRTMAWTARMFRWAIGKDLIDASPATGLTKPAAETPRKRVLSDDELRELWPAFDGLGYPFGPFLKLLLLTGQRRSEIASLRWDEIDDPAALILLSPERYKTGTAQAVPLAPAATAILASLTRFDGCNFAFTVNGATPINGFGKAKQRVDAAVLKARQEAGGDDAPPMAGWVLHDLRRTVRTNLPKLGIASDVAERVMGHVIGGVRGAYDRYDYLPQKRHALETWARYLAELVEPRRGNVVAIHDGAKGSAT
ncbi:MAG: integrase arm-type DNA-binding domain-containing protein [Dongiaceae bacterium]